MHYPVFQRSASFCFLMQTRLTQVKIVSLTLTALTLILVHVPASSQAQTAPSPQTEDSQTAPVPSNARPILRLGSQGESVSELQALLKLLGYYADSVDGMYRASTAAAVSAFQQAIGLQADGVVGPATWNQLLPPSPGSTAAAAPTPTSASTTTPAASPAPTPTPAPTPVPAPATSANTNSPAPAANSEENASIDFPILRTGMRGPAVARLQERLNVLGFYEGAIDGVFGAETQAAVQAAQRSFDLEPDGVVGTDTWSALLR